MTTRITPLRDVIEKQLDVQWTQWSQKHPNLAAAIDRTRLVEATVHQVHDDPAFQRAMREASLDAAQLAAAAKLLGQVDQVIQQVLRL
ncbi:MAG: hypothetical protein WD118_07140 [Phycisphaeraceae bacterium]